MRTLQCGKYVYGFSIVYKYVRLRVVNMSMGSP